MAKYHQVEFLELTPGEKNPRYRRASPDRLAVLEGIAAAALRLADSAYGSSDFEDKLTNLERSLDALRDEQDVFG